MLLISNVYEGEHERLCLPKHLAGHGIDLNWNGLNVYPHNYFLLGMQWYTSFKKSSDTPSSRNELEWRAGVMEKELQQTRRGNEAETKIHTHSDSNGLFTSRITILD